MGEKLDARLAAELAAEELRRQVAQPHCLRRFGSHLDLRPDLGYRLAQDDGLVQRQDADQAFQLLAVKPAARRQRSLGVLDLDPGRQAVPGQENAPIPPDHRPFTGVLLIDDQVGLEIDGPLQFQAAQAFAQGGR